MIYTDMEHLGRYRGITPALDTAIAYLLEHGLEGLTSGRNEVDGGKRLHQPLCVHHHAGGGDGF